MSYKKLDFYLIPFSFLCFLISSYFLVSDQILLTLSNQPSIAEITSKTNIVKIRKGNSLFWGNTYNGDKLDENDKVYTHKNSDAQISINNGPKLDISENTLLSLSQFSKNKEIVVDKGFIVAELNSSSNDFKLNLGNKVVHLNSKNAKIQINKDKNNSSISILEGKVNVTSSSKSLKLEQGHIISADKNNDIVLDKATIKLITPRQGERIFSNSQSLSTLFSWSKITNGILQISKEYTFKKVLYSKNISSESIAINLSGGKYFWRIISEQNKSITKSFVIIPERSTIQQSPRNKEVIEFSKVQPTIYLKWTDKFFTEFELSINTKTSIVKDHSIKIHSLKPGEYTWKVRPLNSPKSKWSTDRVFTIRRPAIPTPPKLLFPLNKDEVIIFPNSKAVFRWNRTQASSYRFEIAEDIEFSNLILSKDITKNIQRVEFKKSGKYFWRVKSIDSIGRATDYTTPFSLDVNIYKSSTIPDSGAKLVINKPSKKVEFKWKDLRTKKNKNITYIFELSMNSNFNKITTSKKVNTNFIETSIPKIGTYFWRTKILVQGKPPYYGEPQQVTISPTPPPKKPVIEDSLELELKINFLFNKMKSLFTNIVNFFIPSVSANDESTSAVIKWDKIPDTKKYYLEIYKDKDMKNKIIAVTLDQNEYKLINFQEGTYYWRISTLDFWNRKSIFSNLSTLSLTLPEEVLNISKSELELPKNNSILRGDRKKIYFSWTESPEAKKYKLYISKDENFKKIHLMRTLSKNNYVNTLSKGNYFWKVISLNKYDRENSSSVHRFIIRPDKSIKRTAKIRKKRIKKIKRKKVNTISRARPFEEKSNLYFRYDIAYSRLEQTYPSYTINAKDPIFSSFELGLTHLLQKGSVELKARRFSGKVFNDLSYGVLELNTSYHYPLTEDITIGTGITLNSYKSYLSQSNEISLQKNSSLNFPILLLYKTLFKENRNNLTLTYSIGSFSKILVSDFIDINFKKDRYFSLGLGYEKYSTTINNSELKISNILGSFRYNISY